MSVIGRDERWTIVGQLHDSFSAEWDGLIRGRMLGPGEEIEVVPASQLQGAVGALLKIAAKGPAVDMRGVALNELKRQGIDPATYEGQRAESDIGQPREHCPHPAWNHEAEACVACGAAPSRAVAERDQQITDLEAQLASAVRANEKLRAEVERLNDLLVAHGES